MRDLYIGDPRYLVAGSNIWAAFYKIKPVSASENCVYLCRCVYAESTTETQGESEHQISQSLTHEESLIQGSNTLMGAHCS